MLGTVSEAEDIVQEALLRVHQTLDTGEQIASPRAFVATVKTRLAINELRSARARRERYVGEWLPEPLLTDSRDDPAERVETAYSLSLAMVVLLEVGDGEVTSVRSIVNPDKLAHLGRVADLGALLRSTR